MHRPGEGFVLELLFHRGHVHLGNGFGRPDQCHGSHEADQLVDGVEDLLHGRGPRRVGVVGVGEDGIPDLLWPAALLQDLGAFDRVLADRRVALVVVVVEQTDHPPDVRFAAVLRGVGPHRRLNAQGMLDQAGVLGELVERRPGILPAARHWSSSVAAHNTLPRSRGRAGWGSSPVGHFGLLTGCGGRPTLTSGGLVYMARHLHHWLDMVEAVLIIGILLAIAWVTWQALTQAYSPVFNIFSRF